MEKVYVTGCLSERYKPALEEQIPDVDAYFGTRDMPQLLKVLGADYKHELVGERMITTPKHFAYLKVQKGATARVVSVPFHWWEESMKYGIEDLVTEAES